MRRAFAVTGVAIVPLLAGCVVPAAAQAPRAPRAAPLAGLAAPQLAGTIVVMGIEFPAPGTIGGHFSGIQFERQVGDIVLTDGLRNSWQLGAAIRTAATMEAAGYSVRNGALPTSDAQGLAGVRFGLSGRVAELRVRTAGATGPHRADASVEISWELLDLAVGAPVLGMRTRGRGEAADTLRVAVLGAIQEALAGLLADSIFTRAITSARPVDWDEVSGVHFSARPDRSSRDSIVIRHSDLNHLDGVPELVRVAAGTVTLRFDGNREESAFLLTMDGLALTVGAGMSGRRRITARFGTGVERPARVLRYSRRAGVALIQVSCPDRCVSVPWTLQPGGSLERVTVLGAPFGNSPAYMMATGTTGGRRGRPLGSSFDLEISGQLLGGEAVSRADGTVFAMVQTNRFPRALLLREAFRVLRIRTDSIP
jgi:hypothetical protein